VGRILNRPGLRARLLLVTAGAMVVVAALLGWAAVGSGYMAEDAMARAQLVLVQRAHRDARAAGRPLPDPGPWIRIIEDPREVPGLERPLAELDPGIHEIGLGAQEWMVAVEDAGAGARRWYLYDLAPVDSEADEDARLRAVAGLMLAGIVAGAAVFWLVLTRWLVAPLRRLRDRVATRPADDPGSLAAGLPADEIGDLAAAFDRHHRRIRDLLAREQSFARDASHELRTPLTVMGGALDLLDQEPLSPRARRCVVRLQRAQAQMHRQVGAFLLLAREPGPGEVEAVPLRRALDEAVERTTWLHPGCDGELIQEDGRDAATVAASPLAVGIVLDNLLRNAVQHRTGPGLALRLDGAVVTVSNPCADAPGGPPGFGLGIIDGLCRRCGWVFTTHMAGGRFIARVDFAPAVSAAAGGR
jgi:signal transduction histidine kinase